KKVSNYHKPKMDVEEEEEVVDESVKCVIREVIVKEHSDSGDSSDSESSFDDEIGKKEKPKHAITPEYWHIQKLIKYLKTGNPTATVVILCCLKDHDLTSGVNQQAIQLDMYEGGPKKYLVLAEPRVIGIKSNRISGSVSHAQIKSIVKICWQVLQLIHEIGGLEILINLLETKDLKCKLGALSVLTELSQNQDIRLALADLGGIDLLVRNLTEPARDLRILVAETIFNVAQIKKARKETRKCGGIPKLVDLLDVPEQYLTTPRDQLLPDEDELVNIAKAAVKALWSVSRSKKNVRVMMNSGSVPLLARLLRQVAVHMDVVIPTTGTISQCANDSSYQLAIQTEGMIMDIVKHLGADDYPSLRRYCAETIFKCSENALTRDMVRKSGGLDPLVAMAKNPKTKEDKPLLAAVTGAIWKTAMSPENVERFDQLKTVEVSFCLKSGVISGGA
ncbi:hypothetical protein NQ318_008153, partial [Aromia moschata]